LYRVACAAEGEHQQHEQSGDHSDAQHQLADARPPADSRTARRIRRDRPSEKRSEECVVVLYGIRIVRSSAGGVRAARFTFHTLPTARSRCGGYLRRRLRRGRRASL
jgi:hypothetical protein